MEDKRIEEEGKMLGGLKSYDASYTYDCSKIIIFYIMCVSLLANKIPKLTTFLL